MELERLVITRMVATGDVPLPVAGAAHWILVEEGVLRERVDGVERVLPAGSVVEVRVTVTSAARSRGRRCATEPVSVHRARCYIDLHYRERISLSDVATAAGVAPARLRADLARWCGTTFTGLLRHRRIAAAVRLLEGDRPLGQIALECGFCDQSHFARAFRSVQGVSPSRYRRATTLSVRGTPGVPAGPRSSSAAPGRSSSVRR